MARFVLKQQVGRATAFIAAYALALNIVLTSLLAASISPALADAGHVLCFSSVSGDPAQSDAGKSGQKTAIHCPLCVGHHVTGALSPPQPVLGDRSYVRLRSVLAFEARLVARFRSYDHQSRGPPDLT
ncbi:DUF2946 family protein [Bradyrhizobium elkanii]|uniref:DUF2946 family protein n=1 Tax=Bradyrhizobium elkanii TaxID=29448 RepID=UPI001BA81450|nr:DUF2946 family protein [Bradyrhizobium elkanii]MBR1163381.1 hypothetical protein [Bradyrhizobium elkanii]